MTTKPPHNTPFPVRKDLPFTSADDVPISVRDHIRAACAQGHSPLTIAQAFGYPVEWVEQFLAEKNLQ